MRYSKTASLFTPSRRQAIDAIKAEIAKLPGDRLKRAEAYRVYAELLADIAKAEDPRVRRRREMEKAG